MTREEVIRGLERCLDALVQSEHTLAEDGIVMSSRQDREKRIDTIREAIAFLKTQEPVAPELQSGGNYVCGACGVYTVGFMHPLTGESVQTWKYCGKCGKKVRWDG